MENNNTRLLALQDFATKNIQKYKTLIDNWIAIGPRNIKERVCTIADKALAAKAITEDEFFTLLECASDEPNTGDGMCKFSFSLEECKTNTEFKDLIASVMTMLVFFGAEEQVRTAEDK